MKIKKPKFFDSYLFKRCFFAITHPHFWESNEPSNEEVDKFINHIIDEKMPYTVGYNRLTITVGEYEIWTGNYPFSYGFVYKKGYSYTDKKLLPYRITRKRLHDYVKLGPTPKDKFIEDLKDFREKKKKKS